MSRSNPTETLSNPSTKFIDWSGSEGKFKYYDKEKKELPISCEKPLSMKKFSRRK